MIRLFSIAANREVIGSSLYAGMIVWIRTFLWVKVFHFCVLLKKNVSILLHFKLFTFINLNLIEY